MGSTSRTGVRAVVRWGSGILGVILWGSGLVFGQGFSAAISGVVRDVSGAVIPDATVSARNTETALTRTTQTSAGGVYNLPSLPVGPYELTVEKIGFRQLMRSGISLSVAQEVVLNLTLEVGQVTQTVEVTGEAPLVNTTLSPTSGLINEGQIKDLPLNGRSFEQLLTLNTGMINNESNTGSSSSGSFSVAGKRTETNRFTMNGVDYMGSHAANVYAAPQGASGYLLGVDAVREYNVLGHTYGAEYGKRAGGQITVVTTSGTNQLHGSAFEFLRNNKLDARNFFTTTEGAPPFKRNQFGGSLGGPIVRDKMFVFGNYEGFRERLGVDTVAVVPSFEARQGRLPNYLLPGGSRTSPDAGVYAPVPNLVPGILPFFRYWPEPNGEELLQNGLPTGAAYHRSNPTRRVQEDFGLARFDYTLSSRDSLSTNFTADKGRRDEPGDTPNFRAQVEQSLYALSAQETHIFSPTILNVATFGYSGAASNQQASPLEPFPENLLFLRGEKLKTPGAIIIGGGTTTAQTSGFTAPNGQNPLSGRRRQYTGANDLRLTRGRHNLSLGVWFLRFEQSAYSVGQNNAGAITYPTILAMLQDAPTRFATATKPTGLNFRHTEAAWYIQDEIKLRPNLTVRLGLRDEMTTGWNERDGHAANYSFDPNGVILTNTFVGKSALLENNALALWQPRVGVAWDPTGRGDWAVRAGFGIHNDLQDNLAQRFLATPPFNGRLSFERQPLLSFIPILADNPPQPQCQTLGELNARPRTCTTYAPGGIDPILHTPTIQQWSLEVEREITQDLAVQVGYVGSQSYHLSTTLDMNMIPPVRCENPAGCLAGGTLPATQRNVVPQGTEYIPAGLTRPNPFVTNTLTWMYFGTSSYHSLNVSLTKRSRGGLMFKTNYTWAKVLDINSGILSGTHQNEAPNVWNRWNLKLDKGIASYSLLHQFNTSFSYELPFGQGKAFGSGASGWVEKLIGGWQWNGIVNAQGGFPINPIVGSNRTGNGDTRNPDRPNRNPDFQGKVIRGSDGFKKTGLYFDPNAFSIPLAGTFGYLGRGVFRGPGLVNVDTSFFKTIPLNERWNVQFRAEAFNILNHANFSNPTPIVFAGSDISPSAGVITDTITPGFGRQVQFALRLEF